MSDVEKKKRSPVDRIAHYTHKNKEFIRSASLLNLIYFVSCFGDRLWSFSLGLFITHIGGLSWIAVGQMTDSFFKLAFSPAVGVKLDRVQRDRAIQLVLAVNNISIIFSCVFFFAALSHRDPTSSRLLADLLLILAIVCNAVARVAGVAQKTMFTKDWIVVIVKSNPKAKLSTHNSSMQLIDQAVACFSPIFCGFFMDLVGLRYTCIFLLFWNLASWLVEASVLGYICRVTPTLRSKKIVKTALTRRSGGGLAAWKSYVHQSSFLAAFGLALSYMTILGFDNISISYGVSQGLSASLLGIFRSGGALFGALGSLSFPFVESCFGLLVSALIGYTIQIIFINFCSVSTFLDGNPFDAINYLRNTTFEGWFSDAYHSLTEEGQQSLPLQPTVSHLWEMPTGTMLFFSGIMFARFGLWMTDLSVTQIMQETIPESERYSVFGVQSSVCSSFSIIKDILVFAFPFTVTFGALTNLSCAFWVTGFFFVLAHVIKNCDSGAAVGESAKEQPLVALVEMSKDEQITRSLDGHDDNGNYRPSSESNALLADTMPEVRKPPLEAEEEVSSSS